MSKIAKQISKTLREAYSLIPEHFTIFKPGYVKGEMVSLESVIDQALEGKIISKSEVDALRKDAENMQSAQDAYNYTESLNSYLRCQNSKLYQENVNLKLDNAALKMYPPVYYAMDWGKNPYANWSDYNVKFTTTPGQIIAAVPCDICQKLDPPNATHGHSDFEKFVRRLKFWR